MQPLLDIMQMIVLMYQLLLVIFLRMTNYPQKVIMHQQYLLFDLKQ